MCIFFLILNFLFLFLCFFYFIQPCTNHNNTTFINKIIQLDSDFDSKQTTPNPVPVPKETAPIFGPVPKETAPIFGPVKNSRFNKMSSVIVAIGTFGVFVFNCYIIHSLSCFFQTMSNKPFNLERLMWDDGRTKCADYSWVSLYDVPLDRCCNGETSLDRYDYKQRKCLLIGALN